MRHHPISVEKPYVRFFHRFLAALPRLGKVRNMRYRQVLNQWAVQDSNYSGISAEKPRLLVEGDAQSDALATQLAEIIVRWKKMPVQVVIGILAMVRSAGDGSSCKK